jgi:hypothetical protein
MLRRTILCISLSAAAFAGCSTPGYEAVINDQAAQQTMLPKHADFENPGPLQRALTGDRRAQQTKLEEAEQRIARLEQQLQREELPAQPAQVRPTPAERGSLAHKVGVLLDPRLTVAAPSALQQALDAAAQQHPVVLVPAAELEQQLAAYGCQPPSVEPCAERLAAYPGVHFVAEVGAVKAAPLDRVVTTARLHDTANGTSRTLGNIPLQTQDGELTPSAVHALADKIMMEVRAAARAAPWSTRAFNREGDEIYLAAGARSGLRQGMVLDVHEQGRPVRSPTGAIAGWIPGDKKGSVQVTRLFGEDYAVAKLVEGQPPAAGDRLLPAERLDK